MIHPSELVLNPDNSIYHLKLQPEQIAEKIILVGDPGRVQIVSSFFDKIEHQVSNREFITHTGSYKGERISVIATGIGTDNIDIVINELDALVNVDLKNRVAKKTHKKLQLIRLGTCGSIQEDVPADKIVLSTHAFGLDGLMHYYNYQHSAEENAIRKAFFEQTKWPEEIPKPYLTSASTELVELLEEGNVQGITLTAPGFYAPQGRAIRLKPRVEDMNERLRRFSFEGQRVVNYEMETSALYGLSKLLGHDACTLCAVVANRYANSFSKDYHSVIKSLIINTLKKLVSK